jgi:hypothetical protein
MKKPTKTRAPVSLHPLEPEDALAGLMQVWHGKDEEKSLTDHQEIQQAINTWQAELNRVSEEVAAAGMAWLADTTNAEARSRLDAKWDELWQVLTGDQGLALPEGYTLPRPPWNR